MKTIAFSCALIAAVQAGYVLPKANNHYDSGAYASSAASHQQSAAVAASDDDVYASQVQVSDKDSSWGKRYDSVDAKTFYDKQYAKQVLADDAEHDENYESTEATDADKTASAASQETYGGYDLHSNGFGNASAASTAFGANSSGYQGLKFQSWGRDQEAKAKESFALTDAASYNAESYDEWDKTDDDQWMAANWKVNSDAHAASSEESGASASQHDAYGHGYGQDAYGHGHGHGHYDNGYSNAAYGNQAAKSGHGNDVWAYQSYGDDFDSRWGKSYDEVDAKSWKYEQFDRAVQAEDDQWSEKFDAQYIKDAASSHNSAFSGHATFSVPTHYQQPAHNKHAHGGYSHGGNDHGYGHGHEVASYGRQSYGGAKSYAAPAKSSYGGYSKSYAAPAKSSYGGYPKSYAAPAKSSYGGYSKSYAAPAKSSHGGYSKSYAAPAAKPVRPAYSGYTKSYSAPAAKPVRPAYSGHSNSYSAPAKPSYGGYSKPSYAAPAKPARSSYSPAKPSYNSYSRDNSYGHGYGGNSNGYSAPRYSANSYGSQGRGNSYGRYGAAYH